jgi:hypothetical protein
MKSVLVPLAVLAVGMSSAQDQAKWLEDWNQGLAQAKQSGRPIFLVFSAEW